MISNPFAISDNVFQYFDDGYYPLSATLHVPAGTKALYEATAGWNQLKNIVELENEQGKITLDKTELAIQKGQIEVLTATCPSSWEDQSVTWESSDPAIVIVKNGKIKGQKIGTATITCTSVATGLTATCEVTVTAAAAARSLDGYGTTGIDSMDLDVAVKPFDVYDLSGRKVLHQVTSLDALPKGTYIVNGKKVMK